MTTKNTQLGFKIEQNQNNQKTYLVYELQTNKEFNKDTFVYLETDKRTFEQLQSATKYNKPNKFNKAIINYLNSQIPADIHFVRNDYESLTNEFNEISKSIYKYHLQAKNSNEPIYNDIYDDVYYEENGFIGLYSVLKLIKNFKENKELVLQIEQDINLKNLIANNKIINNSNYVFINGGYLDYKTTYFFKKENTFIVTNYNIVRDIELKRFINLKTDYNRFARNNNFIIIDVSQDKNLEKDSLIYTIASLRQIINENIPSFKTILKADTNFSNDKELFAIGHISCKIATKIYYLYEFNTIFKEFKLEIAKYSVGDSLWDVFLAKIPNDYEDFKKEHHLDRIISQEFNKYFKNIYDGSSFINVLMPYCKIFASVYVYSFLKNEKDDNRIKVTIGHIFNNFKQIISKKEAEKFKK